MGPPIPGGRCQHLRADGKRCASTNYPGHDSLCHHHLNREMRGIAGGNIIAADILSAVGNFPSASAISAALGKLLIHQITGHIARQDALAYTFQPILRALPSVKAALKDIGYTKYWREETQRILSGPSDLDEITDPALLPTGAATLHAPHSARNAFARSINSATSTQEWPRSSGSQFARLNSIRPATASRPLVTPPSASTSAIGNPPTPAATVSPAPNSGSPPVTVTPPK